MLSPEQTTTESKVNIENNNETLIVARLQLTLSSISLIKFNICHSIVYVVDI
jgi:hypothetical protein